MGPEERMSVRQALAHPWLQILKQPGIEISEQYQISTERLRTYYGTLKEWYANASCDYLFRRRPLAGAFTHPSCMVYPTCDQEPVPEPEPEPVALPDATEWRRPSYSVESFENPSNYQYGPDTYLMQVKDPDFSARLREYLGVAKTTSAEFQECKVPIIKERRRFTDVIEGEPLQLACLVASEPKAAIHWLKNDLIFMEDSRLSIVNTEDGYSVFTLNPAAPSDAGLYKVVARNPLGQVTATIRVVLGDISGSPDSPMVEAMTDTDILLSWKTPAQLNHTPVIAYKIQMGYIDTDIDWVDLADDIRHEYFVVDNLRPSHGYKFRVLARNTFGWSIPSIPSGIVMTPSTGASKAEFYDALQGLQAKEDINLDAEEIPLSYECEKKPLKLNNQSPGEVDFLCDLSKGRFNVTANVNQGGKICSVKIFDKSDGEGDEASKREFKNLKTLKHEKIVSLVEAFETEKMCLLKFDALPGTDVVSYLAERSMYSEQLVAEITLQMLEALDYVQWRGRVYLNLEPSNVLVCSGRSLGKTVQVKLANFETTQTVSKNGTQIKGTYNFDYAAPEILDEAQAFPQSDVWSLGVLLYVLLSGQLPFKGETAEETKSNILDVKFKFEWLYNEVTMEATRLLMWIFKRGPWKRPSLEEVAAHRWLNPSDYMLRKRERAHFTTNRLQKFAAEYHRSRPHTEVDSATFISKLLS